jgi:hypothetical protein
MIRYVTRWALSSGIRAVEGEYTEDGKYFHGEELFTCIYAKEAFESLEKAVAEAKRMAKQRAANLRKSAEKLESPQWKPKVIE